jgi:hypothetical protein
VADCQFDLLLSLASPASTPAARLLRRELERGVVDGAAGAFARLGDIVRDRDLKSGGERSAVLVTPDRSNMDEGRPSLS